MAFIHEDFMLTGPAARELYHAHAEHQPIIDYHCHLSPQEIAENIQFRDITQLWLGGDHYKWRAMRANGVPEEFITGRSHSAWEVFEKWAETVPYTMRNPLYHWTHLELKRVFGIDKILPPPISSTAPSLPFNAPIYPNFASVSPERTSTFTPHFSLAARTKSALFAAFRTAAVAKA